MPGDKKKKEPELSVSIGYTDEQAVQNGTVEYCETIRGTDRANIGKEYAIDNISVNYELNDNTKGEPKDIYLEYTKDNVTHYGEKRNPLHLEVLRDRLNNGESASSIYNSIKEFIMGNKNNPETVNYAISMLLHEFGTKLYDENGGHNNFSKNPVEFLKTILEVPEDEQLDGFVCIEIHEFGMRLLHDCGIPAVVIGGKGINNVGHASLLYKQGDGKYVHINYNTIYTINADNIKDAAYTILRNSAGLENAGYLELVDDDGSYQEFTLKDESVWGRELDKRDYNNKSVFEHDIATNSDIGGTVNFSNLASISAEANGTLAFGDDNRPRELKGAIAYKKSHDSTVFESASSAGLKIEFNGNNKKENGKTFFETKVVLADTKGENHDNISRKDIRLFDRELIDTDEQVNKPENEAEDRFANKLIDNKTVFIRAAAGKENNLLEDSGIKLSNTLQGGMICGVNYADNYENRYAGDARITLEEGLQLQNNIGNVSLTNNISGGLVGDLRLRGGDCVPTVQPGVKLNGSSGFSAKSGNVVFGAKADGHAVVSQPCLDYGISGNIFAAVKPENSKTTFFGSASLGNTKQQLRLGGMNERTEDITVFGATLGAENKKGSVSLNYNGRFDRLNSTRDRSVISLNAKVNL